MLAFAVINFVRSVSLYDKLFFKGEIYLNCVVNAAKC